MQYKCGDRQQAFKETVKNVTTFGTCPYKSGIWERASQLWVEWWALQKSKDRVAKETIDSFKVKLDQLFDIGSADAVDEIRQNRLPAPDKEQGIAFYQD